MKKYLKIIYVFFIIGLESFGNMSAVMAILEENLIKKNKMVEMDDIIDAVTLSRIGPGATTANAVAYLGNKMAGFWGGVIAGISYTIAPLIVILLIYGFLENVLEFQFVKSAIRGGLIFTCIIFAKSTYEMAKAILLDKFNTIMFILAVLIELIFKISCIYIILSSTFIGVVKVLVFDKRKNTILMLPFEDSKVHDLRRAKKD